MIIFSSSISVQTQDSKIFLLSDLSGYYITGFSSTSAVIWRYLFSTPTSSTWQKFSSCYSPLGNLMLSSTEFFFTGASPSPPTPPPVRFYKYTFGNTVPDWTNKMFCSGGTWSTGYSETQVSGSTIYNFFIAGVSYSLYMVSFDVSTGNVVGSRYKSSISIGNVYGSALIGDYLLATLRSNSLYPYYAIMYNIATETFIFRQYVSTSLFQSGIETSTGK